MTTQIYIAAYNQSKFGKLMDMKVPEIIANAVNAVCRQINVPPSVIDVGSIAGACSVSLNEQGLLAGLVASVPGLESKSIESVENACASGGTAVLSVLRKLLLGEGSVGIAVGYEKMRDAEGKMDGAHWQGPGILLASQRAPGQGIRVSAPVCRDYARLHECVGRQRIRPGADRGARIR